MNPLLILALAVLLPAPAQAKIPRSTAAKHDFQRATPCPDNGATRGGCRGWVIDHIVPLCAGGADAPANMQWQRLAESKVKDRAEVRQCAVLRRQAKVSH